MRWSASFVRSSESNIRFCKFRFLIRLLSWFFFLFIFFKWGSISAHFDAKVNNRSDQNTQSLAKHKSCFIKFAFSLTELTCVAHQHHFAYFYTKLLRMESRLPKFNGQRQKFAASISKIWATDLISIEQLNMDNQKN